jgi:clan AA aspartic protease
MPDWIGSFDSQGTPVLKIRIAIPPTAEAEFEAIIDTGFTGFLSVPVWALPIMKSQVDGIQWATLADGATLIRLTVKATVSIDDVNITEEAIIERDGNEVLIGMEFLRLAGRSLLISSARNEVLLIEDSAT